MAITLLKGHVSRALDFYTKDHWFCIGRQSPWEDESNPPAPESTDEIGDPILFKRTTSIYLVKPDPMGELTFHNEGWKIIDPVEAVDEGARWVYLSTDLSYEEVNTNISYRQVSIYTGTTALPGLEQAYTLTPEQIQDKGIPEVLDNRKPVYREPDQKEKLNIVIEF